MPSLAQVALMATATDPTFDARFGAALVAGTVDVLTRELADDAPVPTRVAHSRRRTYAYTVMRDPVAEAKKARWVLASAAPNLCDAYNAGGQAAISDTQLGNVVAAMWDALAEV